MPISRYIETSNLARPGVCTSTTRPASPYEGQVIYETDTDRTLVWNASAWVAPNSTTANPPGLELVKTQTIGTGVASVVVSDVFSSTYDNYLINVSGGVHSAGGHVLTLFIGGVTSGYYYSFTYSNYDATPRTAAGANVSNIVYVGGANSNGLSASIHVNSPFLAKITAVSAFAMNGLNYAGTVNGILNTTAQYTSFTLGLSSGTMTGGEIRVYGYRN
jgi:hypothetical protein